MVEQIPPSPLTVMILTRDEEINIADCLRSVAWADDVVVVDSGSTDRTLDLARSVRPDVRIFSRPFTDFGDQRNWAIDNTDPRNEWVLFLDADERCTPECAAAIRRLILGKDSGAGYYLTCRNYFLGRWLKHSALYPSWQLRLFRKGMVRFRKEGHGQREVTDHPIGYLDAPYDHYGLSKGIASWVTRHNRYTSTELEAIRRMRDEPVAYGDMLKSAVPRRRCLKRLAARVPAVRLLIFIYLYFFRLGFLDGWPGIVFCLLRLANEIHLVAKVAEERYRSPQE